MERSFLLTVVVLLTTASMVAADVDDAEDVDAAEGDVVDGAVRAFFDTTTSRSAAT